MLQSRLLPLLFFRSHNAIDPHIDHQPFRNFEFKNVDTDGTVYWHAIDGEPMFDENGEFVGYQGIGRDITERRRQEALIHNLAFHDPLTGIPNRRLLMERLAHSLKLSARQERINALLFLDLDKFKALNDERGHAVGDLMLCDVAKRLLGCVRQTDTVAAQSRASRPAHAGQPVRLPGERGLRLAEQGQGSGVELHPSILPMLRPWAEKLGVALPAAL